ncbi:thioredoxin [bacterium]|nr:thioredoxin [bacterium]
MKEVTNKNFSEVVENFNGITVVDFWAPWCGPCRMITPILEGLDGDYKENSAIQFVKLNTDESPELSAKFGIRGIPTVKVFKAGKEVDQQIGLVPADVLKDMIGKHL